MLCLPRNNRTSSVSAGLKQLQCQPRAHAWGSVVAKFFILINECSMKLLWPSVGLPSFVEINMGRVAVIVEELN
jgi:hypothetical protein